MPTLPAKACLDCGIATDGGPRCASHAQANTQRRRDPNQLSPSARGYGPRWRKLRAHILRHDPLCRSCKKQGRYTAATVIDHITPKKLGGTDDMRNLQPLCKSCHDSKTAGESKYQRTHTH